MAAVISPEKQKAKNEKNGKVKAAAYCRVPAEFDEHQIVYLSKESIFKN